MNALFAALLALTVLVAPASAATPAGAVSRVQGACTGTVDGVTEPLAVGTPVFVGEEVATGPDARLAVTLDDGTTVTLGENARLVIDAFVFDPKGASRLDANVAGAFRYVSGALAPGAARAASVTTPVAVIGVRGTDFWGGPIDGAFGVALFDGSITVTSGGVTAVLDSAGSSVDVAADGAPPGAVTRWPDDKIARAVATVTFP